MSNWREGACDACNSGTLDLNPCTCIDWRGRAEVAENTLSLVREFAETYRGQWHRSSMPGTFDQGVGAACQDVLAILDAPERA